MKEPNFPDFLIVGAAKCGTTTLSDYLNQHSDIFITNPKEPKFLTFEGLKNSYKGTGDDFTKKKAIKSISEYKQLFKKAKIGQVKGEASVDTLFFYNETIPIIKKYIGDPKIIIMLRNPLKRAFSAYSHLLRDGRENFSFAEALGMEESRLENNYEFIWGYKKGGFYYEPVKAFIENFSNVKVIIFENFIENQERVVKETLSFLGANDEMKISKAHHNVSGKPKSKFVNNIILKDSFVKTIIKKLISNTGRSRIKAFIQQKNLNPIIMKAEDKLLLQDCFKDDIEKLERLLKKDLSLWGKQ